MHYCFISDETNSTNTSASKNTTPTHQPPIMTVSIEDELEATQHAQKMVDENLLILLEENEESKEKSNEMCRPPSTVEETPPIYFRSVKTWKAVLITRSSHIGSGSQF